MSDKYYYSGVYGRDVVTVTIRTPYSPSQFNDAGEEIFAESTVEISGFMDTENITLRRAQEQGRVEYADAVFRTLYQLSAPYPKIVFEGFTYEVMEQRMMRRTAETVYEWYLKGSD